MAAEGFDPFDLKWRRTLLIATPFGGIAFVLGSLFEGPSGQAIPYDVIGYPIMAAAMGFLELLLLLWPQRLRFVVLSIVVGSTAFFLGKLLYVLFMAPTGIDVQDQMSETFFWIPVIYLLSFMIPGMRGGRFTATLFSTLFLGISMVYVGVDLKLANRWGVIYSLVEMNLANTVLLALTYAFIGYTAGFTMIESAVHNGIPKKGSTGSNRTPRWSPWGDSGGVGQGICNPL